MFWGAEELATSWWADVGLFCSCSSVFVQKPEQLLPMAPLSRRRLDVFQTGSWRLRPCPAMRPLRPPAGRASSGPWSVWLSKSFHRWTVRPLFCRSGTCWETRWVWPGSSAGCPGWAASCWGWPQTPGGGRGQTDGSQYTCVFDVRMQVNHYILQDNACSLV